MPDNRQQVGITDVKVHPPAQNRAFKPAVFFFFDGLVIVKFLPAVAPALMFGDKIKAGFNAVTVFKTFRQLVP